MHRRDFSVFQNVPRTTKLNVREQRIHGVLLRVLYSKVMMKRKRALDYWNRKGSAERDKRRAKERRKS